MTFPQIAQPRHFSGELVTKLLDCCLGMHRIEVELVDNDGGKQTVFLAYGRGDAAKVYAQQQFDLLTVGCWYHGSATLMRRTPGLVEWAGHVPPLQPCQRRHRFSQAAGNHAQAAA